MSDTKASGFGALSLPTAFLAVTVVLALKQLPPRFLQYGAKHRHLYCAPERLEPWYVFGQHLERHSRVRSWNTRPRGIAKTLADCDRCQNQSQHCDRTSRFNREPMFRPQLSQIPCETMASLQKLAAGRARLHGKLARPCESEQEMAISKKLSLYLSRFYATTSSKSSIAYIRTLQTLSHMPLILWIP